MNCIFWHTWYCNNKNGNYLCVGNISNRHASSPELPGEVLISGNNHDGTMYRLERVCMDCDHREYFNKITQQWEQIPNEPSRTSPVV